MLQSKTRWVMDHQPDADKINTLITELKITPLVASLLVNRGYDSVDAARGFLFGKEDFYDPFLLMDMEKVVLRIQTAITNQEKMLIFGDYDAGATRF